MCACGCFFLAAALGGIIWTAMHGMWVWAGLIAVAAIGIGWFGARYSNWRPTAGTKN